MKVVVTGSSGLVGSTLVTSLTSSAHTVLRLVRSRPTSPDQVQWDPTTGEVDRAALAGVDAVVHLAGESIASGRWNEAKKRRIRDSRVVGTESLCRALTQLDPVPRTLVCASAIGFYGSRGDTVLDETASPGDDFLAEVCQAWEAATRPAADAGIRVVNLRLGVVLSTEGGALAQMLTPFRLGAGGRVGPGTQYMSWVSLDDIVGIIHHALDNDSLSGPVNAVAPNPATNLEFTGTLGRVLSRPTIFPMPAFAARLAFGEMADALLLSSTRVQPGRLLDSGYTFRHPELDGALRALLR